MQYFGGKQRIAKQLVSFLKPYQEGYQGFFEPFVGGCNIIPEMSGKRIAGDVNGYIIEMYKALQQGWLPPQSMSEEQYQYIKEHKSEKPALTGFTGIGCSYSGKWFGGFARNATGRNYCLNAYNSVVKLSVRLHGITFMCLNYKNVAPKDFLIYCDPPYSGTCGYTAAGSFDTEHFWNTMRKWSRNNLVFISEYTAPDDFECVWQTETKLDIRDKDNVKQTRTEKLFRVKQ